MAARKWTPEQRAAQAAAVRTWQPWKKSTGPKTSEGKAIVSRNAYRGSIRPFSRFINLFYRESEHIETMTQERADALLEQCTKLCDDERIGWLHQKRKQKELHKKH